MGQKRNMQLHGTKRKKERKAKTAKQGKGVDEERMSIEVRDVRETAGVGGEMISIDAQEIQGQQNGNVKETTGHGAKAKKYTGNKKTNNKAKT